jgi:hypothetical protein
MCPYKDRQKRKKMFLFNHEEHEEIRKRCLFFVSFVSFVVREKRRVIP